MAIVAASGPTAATAEEITLTTDSGDVFNGTFLGFKDDNYHIETAVGQLIIAADKVRCEGESCSKELKVTWDVSLWGKRRAFTEHVEKLAELVDSKTNGKFTLNLSYGGLSPSRENLEGISKGAFEMAQFCAGYHPEKNQALNVLELPFLGVQSLEEEIRVSKAVYDHPFTKIDMARWNATLLMPTPLPQQNIMGTGSPPMSLDDFSKMTIRATGGIGDAVKALGAEAKAIPAPQVGQAMAAAEVSGVAFAPHAHMAFGTLEQGTWWTTNLNIGTVNCPVVVNSNALKDLPEQFKEALMSSVEPALDHYVDNYEGVTMKAFGPAMSERGIIELTFSQDFLDSIDDAVALPSAAAWIEENARRGLPAQQLYDLVIDVLSKKARVDAS